MAFILKGSFLGYSALSSYLPSIPEPAAYDTVTFYGGMGGCAIDNVWGRNLQLNKQQIDLCSGRDFSPKWDLDTYLLCQFENSLAGGNVSNITSPIRTWSLYRTRAGKDELRWICDLPVHRDSFRDYTAAKGEAYQYWLFAKNESEVSAPLITDPVEADYDGWFLVDVENDRVYHFCLNLEGGALTQEENVVEQNTNQQYNLFSRGRTSFLSGSISALLSEADDEYIQSADMLEQLREFILSERTKYLKDDKGRVLKVFTFGYSDSGVMNGLEGDPRYVNFSFKECGEI